MMKSSRPAHSPRTLAVLHGGANHPIESESAPDSGYDLKKRIEDSPCKKRKRSLRRQLPNI